MNARLVFNLQVKYQDPAVVILKYSTISLSDDVQAIQPSVSICQDTTADLGGGLLARTVRLLYSADFLAAYPTLALKQAALRGFGIGLLNSRLPGRIQLDTASSDYEAADCPP